MPKIELDGLPVIDAGESETLTVAVSPDDMQAGDEKEHHPIAIDARVSKGEVLIRRGVPIWCAEAGAELIANGSLKRPTDTKRFLAKRVAAPLSSSARPSEKPWGNPAPQHPNGDVIYADVRRGVFALAVPRRYQIRREPAVDRYRRRGSTMKLSDGEKLILVMLADLYKKLNIESKFDPDSITEAIYGDHLWGLAWKYSDIPFEPEPSGIPAAVVETIEYLDMWSSIEDEFAKLSADERARVEKGAAPVTAKFRGFDANHESHFEIARYLIDHLNRFPGFKGRNLNSNMPSTEGYRRMCRVFHPIRANSLTVGVDETSARNLSADEIIAILKEMTDPDSRK